MLLEGSVGLNANNKYSDVVIVQHLLVKHGFTIRVNGICGYNTISAIRSFQSRMKLLPDARVDINGKTIKFLEKRKIHLIKTSSHFSEGIGAKYDVATMKLSQAGVRLLANYEQLRVKIYDDQTGKEIKHYTPGATIGYGHLIVDTKEFERYKEGISASQAMSLLKQELTKYENGVKKFVKVKLTQSQFDALTIFCFNIGIGNRISGFGGSTVVKIINGESNENLDTAWKMWNRSQGKVMKGLMNRRESELKIYYKADYSR